VLQDYATVLKQMPSRAEKLLQNNFFCRKMHKLQFIHARYKITKVKPTLILKLPTFNCI